MTISIDELLAALQNPDTANTLENTRETWSRIGAKDKFPELGLSKSELDSFLEEWMSDNPYSDL